MTKEYRKNAVINHDDPGSYTKENKFGYHIHCQKCGKPIKENKKPLAHTNLMLTMYNILCEECVDDLGGLGDDQL